MANVKSLSIVLTLVFLIALAVPTASAMNIDNFKNPKNIKNGESFSIGNKDIKYNPIWEKYKPIEVKNMFGFGKTLFRGAITQHDDFCGNECSSTMQIYLAEDSVLIDAVDFYTILEDGSRVKQDVRSYQFYANGKTYSLGTEMPSGVYEVKLEAEKKSSRTVDWVIKTQGETLSEWAVWGNISLGDDAEVILNSPADNYTSLINNIVFNFSAEVTGGATLANMSLWTNETGSWKINETIVDLFPFETIEYNSSETKVKTLTYDTYHNYSYNQINVSNVSLEIWGGGSHDFRNACYIQFGYTDDTSQNTAIQENENEVFSIKIYTNPNTTKLVDNVQTKCSLFDAFIVGIGGLPIRNFTISGKNISGVSTQIFDLTIDEPLSWTAQACDSDGDCGFAIENRTVYLDAIKPVINITYPTGTIDYKYFGQNISLNWTVSDTNLEECWYNYNNTNTTVTCADLNASFILTNQRNITFYANDSVANEANFTRSWVYKIFGNSKTYNSTTYETTTEGFKINLTSDGTQLVLADLVYDGTAYTGTKVGNNSEMEFNRNIIISEISIATAQNKSFYWNITYGSEVIPTDTINQSVGRIAIGLCNATLTVPYINFTFKDEETTIATNATIDTSTWTYYLAAGDGTENKTLLYSTTDANESYGFCFIPSDRTLTSSLELQYSDTGYPQRRWSTSGSLTNTTITPILYMLADADGTYSVYQVQDSVGNGIEGVEVQVRRQFDGVWTLVEQGTTDSAGGFTGWLNPDYDHQLTFTKSGYTTVEVTVRPSSSVYTVVMGTGLPGATYNSSMEGLSWVVYPDLGNVILPNTTQTFLFNITANLSNIVSCKMEVVNNNSVSLGSTIGCDSKGGNLSLALPLGENRSVRAIYSIDVGEGYFIIDADAYWIIMEVNIPNRGTLVSFFKYARNLNEFGDDENRQEYSRIVFFFLMLSIVMGYISYTTGWDFSTAGGAMGFMTFIIIFASYGGFLRISYTGTNAWMDQYVVALITSLFSGGYILNKFAREA